MRIRSKGILQFLAPVVAVPAPLRAYGFTSLTLIGDQGSGRRKEKTEGGNPHLRTGLAALIQRRRRYFDVCRRRNQHIIGISYYQAPKFIQNLPPKIPHTVVAPLYVVA